MRRALFVLVLWLVAAPVDAAISFVSRVGNDSAGFGASIASGPQSHTAGHLLVAVVQWAEDGSFPSDATGVTNTAMDTFSACGAKVTYDNSSGFNAHWFGRMFYTASTAGNGSDDVTAAFDGAFGASNRMIAVYEFSGTAASPCDGNAGSSGVGTDPNTTGSITVSASSAVIVAGGRNASDTFTAGSGYTLTDQGSDACDEYKIVSASEAATMTSAVAGWGMAGAAFKVATASGSTRCRNLPMLGVGGGCSE